MDPLKVCVVTSNRADFGLLRPLLEEAEGSQQIDLHLAVTGAHLSHSHGYTLQEVLDAGFTDPTIIRSDYGDGGIVATVEAFGTTSHEAVRAMRETNPDVIIVLGDRSEILAVVASAFLLRIPIAHISGGEITLGSLDNQIRNAITMLSTWHFVASQNHADRVASMGIKSDEIFVVGRLAQDEIRSMEVVSQDVLQRHIDVSLGGQLFVVTFHPATASASDQTVVVNNLTQALNDFPDASVVITGTNNDVGGREVAETLQLWAGLNSSRVCYVPSLGSKKYISLLRIADCVIGNSSSGLVEAPLLGIPSVNIGDRQAGRDRSPTVTDCGIEVDEIRSAIISASKEISRSKEHASSSSSEPTVSTLILRRLLQRRRFT